MAPRLTLHALPPSHPCMTVAAALQLKGLEFDRVDLAAGPHVEQMQEIYGEGHSTVPGLMIDDEPVHGSRTILARLEEIEPEPVLYPSEEVREAERWGDEVFQDLGRRLPWGALHFRPELLATMFGGSQLDGPGTDYAIRMIRAGWKYHGITAARLHDDLAELPGKLDHIEQLVSSGVIGGEQPNAADLQIGATVTVLLPLGDLGGLLSGSGAELLSRRNFPPLAGAIPAGTYPAGWVPAR
jgi:glutathione S-transferase